MDFNILYLIVLVVLWAFALFFHQMKKKYFGASSFVLLLYFLVASFSLIAYVIDAIRDTYTLSLIPFLYLYVCILIACIPVLKYDETRVNEIIKPSMSIVLIFTVIYLVATLFVTIDSLQSISEGAVNLLMDDEAGAEAYLDSHDEVENTGSMINHLFSIVFNVFSDAAIIIFFYYLIYYPKKKLVIILFSIGILVQIISNISQGLRTGTVLRSLSLIVAFITLRKFLTKQQRRFFSIVGIVIGLFIVSLIVVVSLSRFGDQDENLKYGTVGYLGQGNLKFNQYVFYEQYTRHGDRTANTFKQYLGFDSPKDLMKVRDAYPMMKINDGSFSTFVGDFVLDYGLIATLFLFIVFSFIFQRATKIKEGRITVGQLILLFFCMNVVTHGSFYLFSYSFKGNLSILGNLLMYALFQLDANSRKKLI